jgi:hypothetical protein
VRHGHGADPQQHGRQQPGNESRFLLRSLEHEVRQFAIPGGERQVTLTRIYFSSSNTAVSSQLLYL